MKTLRQINIKNRPHYFLNDMINIKKFNSNLLSIDQISLDKVLMLLFITSNISQ